MKKYKLKLDYTEEELKELKRLGGAYDGPIAAVYRLGEKESINDPFRNLRRIYRILDIHKEFDLMADINNVVMGTAIFPEPKKYYVHFIKSDRNSYLSISWAGVVALYGNRACSGWKVKFTRDEVVAIDPRLVPFMEEVEDDEQSKEI